MQSKITKPIIIIGAPRSGTTLLYTILSASSELYSLYNESRFIFRNFYLKKLSQGINYLNDELKSDDLTEDEKQSLIDDFYRYSFNSQLQGKLIHKLLRRNILLKPLEWLMVQYNQLFKNIFIQEHRLIEKTPRNCFKVELMNELFPDAIFVFIKRDGRSNISSLIEGWRNRESPSGSSKRLPSLRYPINIAGYDGSDWRFTLPPGWEELKNSSLEEVCAYQWLKSNEAALEVLEQIPELKRITISYEELIADTPKTIEKICDYTGIEFTNSMQALSSNPPEVNYLDGKPQADKWKKNEDLINNVAKQIEPMMAKLDYSLIHS